MRIQLIQFIQKLINKIMKNPIFESLSSFSKIMFLLFIVFASFAILMVLGILISIPIFGIDISNFKEHFNPLSSGNLNFMKFMQVWQSIAIFVLPPLLAAYLFSNDIKSYLKLKIYPDINSVLILLMIVFFSIPLINYFALLNSQIVLPSSMSGLEASIKAAEQSAK